MSDSPPPHDPAPSPDDAHASPPPSASPPGADSSFSACAEILGRIRTQICRVLYGQDELIDQVLASLIAAGHVLIEGKPGLGKTHLVLSLAKSFGGEFGRIQFTPDLMPTDVTGHTLFDMSSQSFRVRRGPVFTNLLLADEINRAPAKTQAALLEVMQEEQVTIDGESMKLTPPFMVLATQNPIEQDGTYPLPEAQLDRFLMKLLIDYPAREHEATIVDQASSGVGGRGLDPKAVETVCSPEEILRLQEAGVAVQCVPAVVEYAVDLVRATREAAGVSIGGGHTRIDRPRAGRKSVCPPRRARIRHAGRHQAGQPAGPAPPHHPLARVRDDRDDARRHPPQHRRLGYRSPSVMTPTVRLVYLLLALAVLGGLASAVGSLEQYWLYACGAALLLLALDLLVVFRLRMPELSREIPGRFALNAEAEVCLRLENHNRVKVHLSVFDGIPSESRTREMPWQGDLPPRRELIVVYPIRLVRRGMLEFTPAHLHLRSPLGFWRRRALIGETQPARVYPNFEPVLRLMLLAVEHRENQMGIVRKSLAGVSREFHQLRDYQEGDSLSQIDWKASSKRLSLISREFEEQRDQTIILMLDCGRRMRSMDGDLPQFDHCLNAMLLLSYVALRQGDQVGVLGFGEASSWFPPVKGPHSMNAVLNHLFDFETQTVPSDYAEAVQICLQRQKRRALVILLTNLRSEDAGELEPALRSLRSRHVVMLASLRERTVEERLQGEVRSLDDALAYTSAHMYAQSRRQVLARFREHGILTLDETAQALPVELSNRYLEIKQMGMI